MFLRSAIWAVVLAACSALAQSQPQTLKLVNGGTVVGRIISAKDQYVQVALDTGATPAYTNVFWVQLSQETLEELTKNRTTAPFANIFLDPPVRERTTARTTRSINIKQPPRLDRPQGGSLLASPVMLLLLALIYIANIYAGWEVGIYRQWPAAMTAAVAAFVPIIGPAIFLAMPTHRPKEEAPVEWTAPMEEAPQVVQQAAAPAPVEQAPAIPTVPQTIVYPRGQFTFNRRFFETKFAGFLKMVPGEAERDRLLHFKSARGEYTGHRLSKVEPNEVYLQVRKGNATEEVMIPYTEIYEVQVKHKDAA
jgi:hypothetical protein